MGQNFSDISQEDGWELGTGNNYSVNELFEMFKLKFGAKSVFIPDQPGNYKKTLRKNDNLLEFFYITLCHFVKLSISLILKEE